MKIKLYLLSFFAVAFACTPTLNSTSPKFIKKAPPEVSVSHINFRLESSSDKLVDKIKTALTISDGAARYNDWFGTQGRDHENGISAGWGVRTNPNIVVDIRNNEIAASTKLYYWIEARIHELPPALTVSCGCCGEPERTMDLNFHSTYSIDNDWNLISKTNLTATPQDKCLFGVLRRNYTPTIQGKFQAKLDQFARDNDNSTTAKADLKTKVSALWTKMHQSQNIDDNTYLLLNTIKIYNQPVQADNQRTSVGVQIEAKPAIIIGNANNPDLIPVLPAPGITNTANDFKLFLPIQIDYEVVQKELNENFKIGDGDFLRFPRTGKKWFYVKDLSIEGYNDKTVIRLELSGKVKGWIYLSGDAKYDKQTKEIYFDNIVVSPESSQFFTDKLLWLASEIPGLSDFISRKSRTNIGATLDQSKTKIDNYLNSTIPVQGGTPIKLNGGLTDYDFQGLFADNLKQKVTLYFHAAGNLSGVIQSQ